MRLESGSWLWLWPGMNEGVIEWLSTPAASTPWKKGWSRMQRVEPSCTPMRLCGNEKRDLVHEKNIHFLDNTVILTTGQHKPYVATHILTAKQNSTYSEGSALRMAPISRRA
jgi:hypothetical protein